MKVTLIPERCIACGLCQTYSDVFDYHDNGIVKFYQSDQLSLELDETPELIQAIKECPTRAIEH
ncbi:ferredoxin [Streptococcus danieliae]|uniref:Ferredoxin n=1 Tax=Streptococcus danieliae TaxID=747656 RepID=A0A7Z0LD81_9STRE|nr:ferredoxin [Streptococcus danieliae]MBF0699646.1 ferredoxin [Streptococcus danieliae]MBF0717226.1 ferredoxin [Streptococcus danieliae]MCU0082408.1 ferredoxin [Streptococcus danieliae]MVX58948.1 ferredoxin [Streptococcus danieliae]NYS32716.1 ferredoxin [Streptococcus danieliae]